MSKLFCGVTIGALLTVFGSGVAQADLFELGSTFTVNGSNSPDSFSNTVTLSPGTTQSLDGGNLNLTIYEDKVGADEWLSFVYSTPSGSALSQYGSYWSLNELGLQTVATTNFIAAFSQLTIDGVAQNLSNPIFGGYSVIASPVPSLSGEGTGAGGFTDINPPGPLGNLGAYMDPYGAYVSGAGLDPTRITGWTQALEFAPVATGAPEPSTWALIILGFVGVGSVGYRTRKTSVSLA